MPIILLVLALVLSGLGYLNFGFGGHHCHKEAATQVAPPDRLEAQPSKQERCRQRLEDARMLLVGKGQLRDAEDPSGGSASFWAHAVVRTGDTPGGPNGVLFTVEGPSGERYGAGLSGLQPDDPIQYVEWFSFSKDDPERLSLFKDANHRSGFVGAFDPTTHAADRRADFIETMQPAVDECLQLEE